MQQTVDALTLRSSVRLSHIATAPPNVALRRGRFQVKEGEMGVKLDDMLSRLPNDRRAKIEARAAELIAEEMSLRDLRKALGKTQVAVAQNSE